MREAGVPALKWAVRPLAVGLLLGVLGPFGTYESQPLAARLGFWLAVLLLNWAIVDAVLRLVEERLEARLPMPIVTLPLVGALIVWIPCLLVVLASGRWILGTGFGARPLTLAWQVLLLLCAVTAIAYGIERLRMRALRAGEPVLRPDDAGPSEAGGDPAAAFRRRWPAGLAGRLLALEMEDHYLRIHTDQGEALILCRMSDAERELAAADGRRVHRSYWVAREAVQAIARRGRGHALLLRNGLEVPVGRTYAAALRKAGWLDARRAAK